jgi:hypothetical protein
MTLPKSWLGLSQRTVAVKTITWDGEKKVGTITLPPVRGPVLIAVDNNDQAQALTVTLQQKLRVDDTNASAQIGEGETGVVTVTVDEPGPDGEKYSIKVVVPDVEDATDLEVSLEGTVITVALAMKADSETFIPDNAKNTAALVAAAINDEEAGIPGFTAEASGGGSTPFTDAVDPVQFSGGTTEIYFSQYDAEGQELKLTVAGEQRRIFGPFDYFPRFLGGKITLTAAETPTDKDVTIVQVQEI